MTGRDIVKFIVYNELLDKECLADHIMFSDYLPDESSVEYMLSDDLTTSIQHVRFSEGCCIRETRYSNSLQDLPLPLLVFLEDIQPTNEVVTPYNVCECSFHDWLMSAQDRQEFQKIAQYISTDSECVEHLNSFNELISYLENACADADVMKSAGMAWAQYRHECRDI